ncbi:type I-E CRISPR-associated protein Cse1/CasA [Corynebacterium anserum]|nr:type I-E CRISPR-associated protein Cse1/CasA [Corynebacterium anserum]
MFSLLDDPWIQIVDSDDELKLVGIRDIFTGEVKAVRLQGESPAQDYAVMRLLLAIFWRSHSDEARVMPGKTFNFADWFARTRKRLLSKGADKAVLEYLDKYSDRFELFDSTAPFMQVAGLHVKSGEAKHITTIVPESQSDYFSMRAGRARDTLTFAEAARWLVYVQAYDYSGIKSGAVGDTRVKGGRGYPIGTGWTGMTGGTLVMGGNLLDTLILNTVQESLTNPDDRPVWERVADGPDVRSSKGEKNEPQGPADLATWQSRRVLLHNDGDKVVGVVVCNGDKIPDAGANVLADPMTPYRYSSNKSKKNLDVYYPRPYDVERTMWRSLDSLVVAETDGGFSGKEKAPKRPGILSNLAQLSQQIEGLPSVLNVELFSVEYGPQSSSVATTYAARMSLPVVIFDGELGLSPHRDSCHGLGDDERSRSTGTLRGESSCCGRWGL